MAPDILARLESQFSGPSLDEARDLLGSLGLGNRVARSVVYLSDGRLDLLRHNVLAARKDFRDVLWWAEYDRDAPTTRVRSMSDPFDET